ncbi:olfactory receptor 2A7-like [Pseudophryne corroboree]|uniref:olfactory receptor 2A7-like n=1 Tax=Pseudophryne corroboree TaxID=495146 RepID=UPI003081E86D
MFEDTSVSSDGDKTYIMCLGGQNILVAKVVKRLQGRSSRWSVQSINDMQSSFVLNSGNRVPVCLPFFEEDSKDVKEELRSGLPSTYQNEQNVDKVPDVLNTDYRLSETLKDNRTVVVEFLLLGFQNLYKFQIPFFFLLSIVYAMTVAGNFLIISLVSTSQNLQTPMYIFLSHLSLCDIIISTNVTPNMLRVILLGKTTLSFLSCITQLYFVGSSAIIECCVLTVMSYDRYLAICYPLRYTSIMNARLPHYLVICAWIIGFGQALVTHIVVLNLEFCDSNIIDHFFCDLGPVLELSCSDTLIIQIEVSAVTILMGFSQILFIIVTYICIFNSILHISSVIGRKKVFYTCSSHLAVVCIYYGTLIILYVAPSRGYSANLNKILSLVNSSVTPLFNPIIYSLRNKEIAAAMRKLIRPHLYS